LLFDLPLLFFGAFLLALAFLPHERSMAFSVSLSWGKLVKKFSLVGKSA